MDKLKAQIQYLRSIRFEFDEQYVKEWLFEYSCQMIERLGYSPVKEHTQIRVLMLSKLEKMIEPCTKLYWEDEFRKLRFNLTPMNQISDVVDTEYARYAKKKET